MATSLHVTPWVDAVVDVVGEDPRSPYVEQFWLPILGPTTAFLLRRIADRFDQSPEGFDLDPAAFARDIGVGVGNGKGVPAPFRKALDRGERFGLLRSFGANGVVARRKLAPLNRVQVSKLPPRHQRAHRDWQTRQLRRATHPAQVSHATRLAHSLMLVGATADEVADQLDRWDFDHPTSRMAIDRASRQFDADFAPEEVPDAAG